MSVYDTCLEPTVTDQREETMKLMSTADNRQCANKGRLLITAILEKVYFLFIALKSMAAVASLRSATVGSERRWCQTYGLGVKNSFL